MSRSTATSTAPSTAPAPDGSHRRAAVISAAVLGAAVLAAILFLDPLIAGAAILTLALVYLARGALFRWTSMLFALAAVIMFVPVRRFALPIPLPFALEPYRVLIALLLVAVVFALVADPRFRWRPVRFGWAIGIFIASLVISIVANADSLVAEGLASNAVGAIVQLSFLLSVFYLVRQLLSGERVVMGLITFLAWAGVVVAFFAIVERILRVNVFLLLGNFLPLTLLRDESESLRAGGARAYASSQHPIALSVALCMLIPLLIYLAKHSNWPRNEISRRIVHGLGVAMIFGGILSAVSRTGIVVLGAMFLVVLALRPRLAMLLAAFAVPLAFIGAVFLPGVFASTVLAFFDLESLIETQYATPGWAGAGRLADLDPAFREVAADPFFGTGVGSRIVIGPDANAYILDNQVLWTLMEGGVIGVIGLAVLMLAPPIRMIALAFSPALAPRHSALAFTLAVSMVGYVTALFFYDAFSFLQTFLILMLLYAIAAWLLTEVDSRTGRSAASDAALARGVDGAP